MDLAKSLPNCARPKDCAQEGPLLVYVLVSEFPDGSHEYLVQDLPKNDVSSFALELLS